MGLSSREEQLVHYRLDWHRCNLKRRLKKQAPLTEEEFEGLAGGVNASSPELDTANLSALFQTTYPASLAQEVTLTKRQSASGKALLCCALSLSKALHMPSTSVWLVKRFALPFASLTLQAVQQVGREDLLEITQSFDACIILLLSGGHFAGAVFNG